MLPSSCLIIARCNVLILVHNKVMLVGRYNDNGHFSYQLGEIFAVIISLTSNLTVLEFYMIRRIALCIGVFAISSILGCDGDDSTKVGPPRQAPDGRTFQDRSNGTTDITGGGRNGGNYPNK